MSSLPRLPRVLSGIQPTAGSFHLGNYLGAVRQWVTLQDGYDAFYCVVDLHALSMNAPPPQELRERTIVSVAQLLAAGLDPDRCTLFLQSDVPGHSQLAWLMECLTGYGEANRMTQFKDKSARAGADRVTVGLFTYPILQVADILLYQANYVPVGEDQRQHLELTRTLAQRFNTRYGETFTVPEPYILPGAAKILDLQDPRAKMSKSLGEAGTVNLLDDPALTARKIRRAVTDTETEIRYDPLAKPGVSNLLTIQAAFTGRTVADVEAQFAGQGYGTLKSSVAETVAAFAEPFAKRTAELLDDRAELARILTRGAERADAVAAESVRIAYQRVGLLQPGARVNDLMLGVAIAIPEPHASVLTRWRMRVGDPAASLAFPHVTLLPPTRVAASSLDDVEKHLTEAARDSRPFVMHLSGTGTFRPTSPVVFIQVAAGVSDCELIEQAVRRGPLARDLDFPYHPHVTVAHGIDEAGLDDAYEGLSNFVARFPVDRFVLFSRQPTGRWDWRSEFPLGDRDCVGTG